MNTVPISPPPGNLPRPGFHGYYSNLYNYLILPAVYDDSISYLEMVGRLRECILKLIEGINKKDAAFYEWVSQQLQYLENELNEKTMEIIVKHNADIARLDRKDAEQDLAIIANEKLIYTEIDKAKEYIYNNVQLLVESLMRQWEINHPSNCNVDNPFEGLNTSIQIFVDDIYTALRTTFALTSDEFNGLKLTNDEFNGLWMDEWEFDVFGKYATTVKLGYRIYSPFTGLLTPINDVIYELAALHKNAITAGEFDALMLTAEQFDAKLLTAQKFDWNGKDALP